MIEWSIDRVICRIVAHSEAHSEAPPNEAPLKEAPPKEAPPNDVNFLINFLCWRIWFLRTKDMIKKGLSKDSNVKLTHIIPRHHSFEYATYSIQNLNSDKYNRDNLWRAIHNCLYDSININTMTDLMREHSYIITYKYNFEYNIPSVISEYTITIWSKFCFGDKVDINLCKNLIKCKNQNDINFTMQQLISNIGNGRTDNGRICFAQQFRDKMMKYCRNPLLKNKLDTIILDNIYMIVSIYNYINRYLQYYMIYISTNHIQNHLERKNVINKCIEQCIDIGRIVRYIGNDNGDFKKGDYIVVDLIGSKQYFSRGPRTCIGNCLVQKIANEFCESIQTYDITGNLVTSDLVGNLVGNIGENVVLTIPSDQLCEIIEHFPYNGIEKFYRIESITENISLYRYLCTKMAQIVNKINESNKIDYLIMSEARGFLFTPISHLTAIPTITVRKAGRIAGDTYNETYNKINGDKEVIQLSVHSPIKNCNVIIIDDGIASGSTTQAVYNLVKKGSGNVVATVVAIRHLYIENKFKSSDIYHVFEAKSSFLY